MSEGEHTHEGNEPHVAEHALEEMTEQTQHALDAVVEAAEHAPEGAAEIPHDLHEELVNLHTRHEAHERRMDGIETQLQRLFEQSIARPVETIVEEVPEKAAETEGEALEMPEEVIKPRKIHLFHKLPRWL